MYNLKNYTYEFKKDEKIKYIDKNINMIDMTQCSPVH